MPSTEQLQSDIARLKKEEVALRKKLSDAETAATKARAAARDKRSRAVRRSTPSMMNSHLKEAERLEKKAAQEEQKAADVAKKLTDNSAKQAAKLKAFETAAREKQRRLDREDERRRHAEKRHAREVAPTLRHLHEVRVIEPPKPERLRVLYLAANPDMDLRLDVEVRGVREALRKSLHRDLIEIDHRPAATPEDLLDGINEIRPHVVQFSGHGGGAAVLFDDAQIRAVEDSPAAAGRAVSFDLLAQALRATDTPPIVLILNACDTLRGAEVLLDVVPVVIAMADDVSDLAAAVFAARFYSSVASAQSVAAALAQATVAVDAAGLKEGWKPEALAREDIELGELVLVRPPTGRATAVEKTLAGSLPEFPDLTWEDFERGSELARHDTTSA